MLKRLIDKYTQAKVEKVREEYRKEINSKFVKVMSRIEFGCEESIYDKAQAMLDLMVTNGTYSKTVKEHRNKIDNNVAYVTLIK